MAALGCGLDPFVIERLYGYGGSKGKVLKRIIWEHSLLVTKIRSGQLALIAIETCNTPFNYACP